VRIKLILVTLSLLTFFSVSFALAEGNEYQKTLNNFKESVREFTLENGLRVIFYKRGDAPVFAGVVAARVGGSDEVPGETGISHMFEHMAFKGTSKIGTSDYKSEKRLLDRLEEIAPHMDEQGNLPEKEQAEWADIHKQLAKLWISDEFTREYERRGASGMNATTDSELTRYFVNLPSSEFDFWCRMEAARLKDPVMRQFYQEREVVLEERRMRTDDSPEGKLYEMLLGVSFLHHRYQNPVIGYVNDLKKLTASHLDKFRKRFYVPGNIVIAFVGDVDPDRDLPIVTRYFGDIPSAPMPARPTMVEPKQEGERSVVLEHESSPAMYVGFKKPIYPDPDDAVISVMSEILAGSSVSPLYTELVKDRKIATSVDVFEAPGNAYPNLLLFGITPKFPHSNLENLTIFDQIIDRLKEKGPTEQQVKIAKRAMAVEYLGKLKSNSGLAVDLASVELLHHDWKSLFNWYDQVMNVSAADIKRVANQYLVRANRVVARVEDKRDSNRGR